MKNQIVVALLLVVFLVVGIILGRVLGKPNTLGVKLPTITPAPSNWASEVKLDTPKTSQLVKSPLEVKGAIKRNWTFEAVMTIWVLDSNKAVIGGGPVYTTLVNESDEWVSFKTSLTFNPVGSSGFLQIKNDNPSGLPENDKIFEVPLRFQD
ncbi:MAG: Gmad2 immunoglobulin-like domain-containing protein [Candidatus Shapirobacteria bacterium]